MFDHQNDVLSNFTKYRFPNHLFPVVSPSSSHYMVVSWNRGTSKSYILMGFSIINQPFLDTPICGNPHITIFHHYSSLFTLIKAYSPLLPIPTYHHRTPLGTAPPGAGQDGRELRFGGAEGQGQPDAIQFVYIYSIYIYICMYVCMYKYIYMYVCNVM